MAAPRAPLTIACSPQGMHNLASMFIKPEGNEVPIRGDIRHGDNSIVIVEQGYIGLAMDNGQPILLPPGLHQWKSDTMCGRARARAR